MGGFNGGYGKGRQEQTGEIGAEGRLNTLRSMIILSPCRDLSLGYPRLSGTVPALWALPSQLEELSLNNHDLSGSFFTWKFPGSLTTIQLHGNMFSGRLPGTNWSLPSDLRVSK